MDSNHRSETQQIYSLPPLATREFSPIKFFKNQSLLPKQQASMELVDGPTELHQRIQLSLLHSLFNFECLYNISHSSSFVNTFFKLFLIFLKHFHFLKMSSNESARLLYHPQSYSSRVFAKKFFIVFFDKISYEFFVAPLLNCKPFGLQLN